MRITDLFIYPLKSARGMPCRPPRSMHSGCRATGVR